MLYLALLLDRPINTGFSTVKYLYFVHNGRVLIAWSSLHVSNIYCGELGCSELYALKVACQPVSQELLPEDFFEWGRVFFRGTQWRPWADAMASVAAQDLGHGICSCPWMLPWYSLG